MGFLRLPDGYSVNNQPIENWCSETTGARYLYLVAGTHGDEPESVYTLNRLFAWLTQTGIDIPMLIIPALSPDGLEKRSRGNANGVDLNRNFPTSCWVSNTEETRYFGGKAPISEPENRFLVKRFKQYPPGFILTFHSWKPMLNNNAECEDVLQWLSSRNGYPIVREDIEDHPTPGSLGTYASTVLDSPYSRLSVQRLNNEQP